MIFGHPFPSGYEAQLSAREAIAWAFRTYKRYHDVDEQVTLGDSGVLVKLPSSCLMASE